MIYASNRFGSDASAGGWVSDDIYNRQVADVNGDGRADIVGFGYAGTYTALGQANGTFGPSQLALNDFGRAQGWTSNDATPREVADVNGDGHADIVAFGHDGVHVALGLSGGSFTSPFIASDRFGSDASAGGWVSDDIYNRQVADVNGDGRADIVGFGYAGTYTALGQANGTFGPSQLALNDFGRAQGWTSNDATPREVADVNGDGHADIVAFGHDGVYVAFGTPSGTFT